MALNIYKHNAPGCILFAYPRMAASRSLTVCTFSRHTYFGLPVGRVDRCVHLRGSHQYAAPKRPSRAVPCKAFSDGERTSKSKNPFQYTPEPSALQKFLADTPKVVLLCAAVAGVAGSGLLGNFIGSQAPAAQRMAARAVGTALAAGAALFGVKKLKEMRESGATIELYNTLAAKGDLSDLTPEEIQAIQAKYDVNLASKRVDEVKSVYDTFVESVIPVHSNLTGSEVEQITSFKDALGLGPEDAAAAHMDVGRRFQRLANEAAGRGEKAEYKKALNKLIYVSGLVFGERQEAFLLPWKRLFGYTDATLYVAKRDQAKALFKGHLDALGGELQADRQVLASLKDFQKRVRLEDSIAEEAIVEASRAHVESCLDRAIECLKRRTRVRDYSDLVKEVRAVLDYSQDLAEIAGDPDLPKGLGKVTIYGGRLEKDNKQSELRDVFRTYLEEQLRSEKEVTTDLEDDLEDLQQILALGKKEAADIVQETTSKVYRTLLRDEVTSGRLDAATSKAQVLAELCERLNFDAEAAAALHRQLYRQKLDSLLEKKSLTDEDAAELDRQRRLLCIKKADVRQLHRETCGRIYTEAVDNALNAGHEGFTSKDRENVLRTMRAVRLDPELAKEILATQVRKAFVGFVSRSRNKSNKLDAAKELKALVFFSNIVVAPLLEDINNVVKQADEDMKEAAGKEIAELMIKAKEQADKELAEAADQARAAGEDENATSVSEAVESAEVSSQPSTTEAEAKAEASPVEAAGEGEPSEAEAKAEDKAEGTVAKNGEEEETVKPETLRKSEEGQNKEEASSSGKGMRSQKEITLRDELDQRDRLDIYRNFLLYCMSGNVVQLPMGTSIQIQRDESEFVRLSQLGDILGLSPLDVSSVHTGLAEQAYRQQVMAMSAGGNLTAERVAELEDMREKFGLSKESASKIIKGAQNQHLIANLNAAKAQGGLTLQKILDMKDQGIEVEQFVSSELLATLYTKEMADVLSNGTGEFDRERFLVELPQQLGIKERRVKSAIEGLAKDRKRTTLVQGISYLRQKKLDEAVKSLNNLLACHKALPTDKPEQWDPREEVLDLWSIYISKEQDGEKQSALATVLDISDQETQSLRSIVESGQFKLAEEAEESEIF